VIEGQSWVDARANYDGALRTGRYFGGNFSGIGIHLNSFLDTYRQTGQPMDFVSSVQLLGPDGGLIRSQDIRVNHPAQVGDLRIFQYGYGWAPDVEVRLNGQLIASGPIALGQQTSPKGVPQLAMPWIGVLKLPSLRPQAGLKLELWPDSRAFFQQLTTGRPVAMLQQYDPFIRFTVYRGTLVDLAQNTMDTTGMQSAASGIIGAGQTIDLTTGKPASAGSTLTVSFPNLAKYSVFQVTRDNGVPIVMVAAILILLGLLPAMYTSRRKVWVHAVANGRGTVLKIGGFSLQRKGQFEEEFGKLVDALVLASGKAP
jgi:cytochrome c biogenesis protein